MLTLVRLAMLTMVKTTLTAAITKTLAMKGQAQYEAYDMIDKAPEEKSVVSPSIPLTLSMKPTNVTTPMLTAPDMLTMLRT